MKLKKGNCCIPCHFCTFCVYRLRKLFLNKQYKHKTGIFFHNRNWQRRRAERKTERPLPAGNQLFADHKDAWDKAFGLMNKNAAGDAMSENYADSLASTVESNKDSFSEEEYETLCKDIETIRGIEEEIAKLEKEIAASDSSDSSSSKSDESTAVFKASKEKIWMETM